MAIHPLARHIELLPEELRWRLRDVIYAIRGEWHDSRSRASFGLLPARERFEGEGTTFTVEAAEIIELLRLIIISKGLGTEGLRRLSRVLSRADAEAREITPGSYRWSPGDLDLSRAGEVEIDDGICILVGASLTYDSNVFLLEDWLYTVLAVFEELFKILFGEVSLTLTFVCLLTVDEFDPNPGSAPNGCLQGGPSPPKRQVHMDVVRSVTPTNGPNSAASAIESSVRVCGVELAA